MDVSRYVDLYLSETQEYLRSLNRALLELETGGGGLEEAFRAAHTIKGMSAAMGYRAVTELAHRLEDRLAEVRAGRLSMDAALVDELLADADALERAVAAATAPGGAAGEAVEVPGPAAKAEVAETAGAAEAGRGPQPAVPGGAPAAGGARGARTIRVDPRAVDEVADGIGELSLLGGRLEALAAGREDPELGEAVERLGRVVAGLQRAALELRMVPVSEVFDRFPRVVRDAARALGKEVDFRLEGRDIRLDRAILEEVAEPLVHLLRNAVDHGIEPPAERAAVGKERRGRVLLRASRQRSSVLVEVEDDGRGVDRKRVLERARRAGLVDEGVGDDATDDAVLRILSRSGFSTASEVTEVSGRGVGLDVATDRVRALGGSLELRTRAGAGCTFVLRLPLTLALAEALRVRVGGEDYAIPLTHVAEAVEVDGAGVGRARGREVLRLRGAALPLVPLRALLGAPGRGRGSAAVVAEVGARRVALAVDELVGREQIVVKGFDAPAGTLPVFSGVALLADGRPALVLDPVGILERG